MIWHSPWYLWLLVLLLPLVLRIVWRKDASSVPFSSLEVVDQLPRSWRQNLLWLPGTLTVMALAVLIIAMARPRAGSQRVVTTTEGIAIEMVIDRSSSMRALDFKIDGQEVDRLTAIKNVASRFVLGDEQAEGRISDLIGLVTFAGYADAVTPPTLDHAFLVSQLGLAKIVSQQQEDGTAIGDALALAVEKLDSLDARRERKVKSKVMILLTDGQNTAGELTPVQAAELAQTLGIKVYTIGVGTNGKAPVPVPDVFTGRTTLRWMQVNIDETTLKQVAELTGGKYFRATDTSSLEQIYREIDALEKTQVESKNFVDYRELATQSWQAPAWSLPPLIWVGFGFLLLRIFVECFVLRGIS